MTSINLLLGLALVVYICSKQLTWRPVNPAQMFKLPLILGVIGVVSLSHQATTIHPIDAVILGLSAVMAVVSGALMGRITRFRPSPADPRLVESRTGGLGVAIWIGLIAVRVVLDVAGHRMGSDLAVSTGSILLVLAINRATSALVISARQPHAALAMAGK
ncbi:hypothetical protein BJ973_004814 [Actinoplanes tereljensis]|uniref:DUF1453 domain-containing protein n=1 Tax=Paractinoplanes tereljensis TaxID=571912 RepID=A0A919TST7_9ACTN|nr:hypothetical protein [Actinoplanes tereljensis]GIF21738.1 hypothetical protein Ate02nite_44680 [Actinoplanes tereljensis]